MEKMILFPSENLKQVQQMKVKTRHLRLVRPLLLEAKEDVLTKWLSYKAPKKILRIHEIDVEVFTNDYANGIFDYFMGVISGDVAIGNCPAIQSFLEYLKGKEIQAGELYELCSHFRRAMIDIGYEKGFASQEYADEIYFIFDKNFRGVLRFYTDTIFQKEQEIDRHVKLLSEYKKALDEGALITKTDSQGHITYVNEKFTELSGYSEAALLGRKHNIMRHPQMTQEFYKNLWDELLTNNIFRGTIKNLKNNGEYFYVDVTIVKINDPYDNTTEYMSIGYDVTKLVDARAEALRASQVKDYFLSNMSHEIRTPLNAILGFVSLLLDENLSEKHRNYLGIIQNSGENLLSIINDILDFSKLRSGEFTVEPKNFSLHEELNHTMELFVASAASKNLTITSFINPDIPKELYADALRIKQVISNFLSNAIKFSPEEGVIGVEASCRDNILKISVKDEGIGVAPEDKETIFLAFTQAGNSGIKKEEGTGLGLSICNQLVHHMGGKIYVESELGKGSTFSIEIPVEVRNAQCRAFDDMAAFKDIKIVFYSPENKRCFQYEAFVKYANMFKMDVAVIDNLHEEFDVALFVHENIDEEIRETIRRTQGKKFIAMMSRMYDDYETFAHIRPMCFPLYCSKMRNIFAALLEMEATHNPLSAQNQKFEGHVLVAEDNEANQELIKILLGKYGLTYDLACNGIEAVALYKQNNYDLILMDEQMPLMDGNEAVQKILKYEKQKRLAHTPVSALTANVIKGAKERGLSSGFDEFLGKPIIVKELERVFMRFLKPSNAVTCHEGLSLEDEFLGEGLDREKLCKELMLNHEELALLFGVYKKKMGALLPELEKAIQEQEHAKIALLAHNIKGSSANFRIASLQKIGAAMEDAAKEGDTTYLYEESYARMKTVVEKMEIR